MFTSASSIARNLSLAIVVALLGSLQVSIASATTPEPEDGYYDCATGVKRADSNTIDPYNAVFVWIIDGKAYNNSCSGNVVLPDGTSGVGNGAFEDSQVTSITIPSSVTRFEDYALVGSASLGDVYFLGNAPDYVGIQAFHNLVAGAKAHITSTATGFGTEPTWNGLNIEVAEPQTVTFNSKGGSSVSTDSINAGEALGEPAAPSRSGYTFQGWSATDGGSAVSFPYSPGVTEDITLYALWSADSHTVTFNSNGGSSIASGSFISGGSIDFSAPSSSRYFGDSLPEGVMALPGEGVFHLGNEVSTSVSGWVTKVYYYRYAEDSLHQSASVWSSDGVLLGSKAFVGGTASGWQSVTLDDPVYIAAGETFIVSVLTPTTPFTVALTEMQSNSGPLSFIAVKASAPTENFVALESNTEALSLVDLQFDVASVPTPTREGFAFQGWSATNGGSVISFPYTPAVLDDITLYAKWSTATYDVTFNSKGGSSVADGSFEHNGSVAIPYDPTREGYAFLGWSDTDGGSAVTFPYTPGVTEDITLYALWSADTHLVTFDSKGGDEVDYDSFHTGGSVAEPFAPTRDGYTFLGWSASDGGSAVTFPYSPGVTDAITLYALWSADGHEVTFDATGGSDVTDQSFVTGGSVTEPTPPTRAGYTFLGWAVTAEYVFYEENVSFPYAPGVIEGITLYARWSADSHTATFDSKGGSSVDNGYFNTDDYLAEPTPPTRAGYTFLGWSDTNDGTAVSFPYAADVTTDITLYALWSVDSHKVTFNSKGGSYVSDDSFVTAGSLAIPYDPTRAGYAFLGWSATDGGSAVTFPYSPGVTEDITLYALWSANSHTVTFDSKGGSSVTNGSFVTNGSVTAPTAPTRAGYTFSGWRTTAEYVFYEENVSFPYAPGVIEGITLYARWSADSHTATFDSKGGSSVDAGVFVTDGDIGSPHSNPGRAGYTFLGWSDTDGGSAISFPYAPGVIKDVTLYALWSADSHTAFFMSQGAYVYYLSYVTDGSLEKPADPVRTGYTFGGWSLTEDGSAVSFPYAPGLMEPITLFAKWSLTNYSVTYNSKGGTSVTAGSFVYGGAVATAPRNPYRSGALFAGWSDTDGGNGGTISFPYYPGTDSNVTLYAKWTILAPLLSTASATTLLPGDLVTIKVSRVNSGCTVTVGWREENSGVSPLSKVIRTDRTTGVFTIATPSTVGRYTLTTNTIGSECSSGAAITLAKVFVVGKAASVVAKVSSSSAFVSKNPAVSVTGTVKSGGVVVASKEVTVSLRRNGVEVATASATTNSAGVFTSSFSGISYLTGDYTAVVTLAADSTYRQTQVTTSKITLR